MIDHVLGRPSTQFRKIQVFAVLSFWLLYILRGNKHGPPGIRVLSSYLKRRMTPWRTVVMTLLTLYVSRNFAKVVGLECPEPLANLYSRSYFRATWITTGLDAGFWTAMKIKRKWLRDLASMVFSVYYLIAAEQADEKVRKVRAVLTVEHLRVSWNKSTTPYLSFFAKLLRPRLCRYDPLAIRIPRPRESSYKEPASGWLYFDGPLSALQTQTTIVLDIPGGGFVAMNPRTSDDKLLAWAGKTGIPIFSLDYKKAPEHPYPYALNECYDVYHTIVTTRGRCLGLNGKTCPKIIITGDSAGGNLATGLTLMILQSRSTDSRRWRGENSLPIPAGLILIYPSLEMNIGSWMTDEQMSLIRDRQMRKTNKNVLRRKSEDYYKLTPATPRPPEAAESDDHSVLRDYFSVQHGTASDDAAPYAASVDNPANVDKPVPGNIASQVVAMADKHPREIRTRLAVSSMISYFNDRIITPEMMRAMIILYIGPYNRPDFSTDFLLSPILAPEQLLAHFPKTYFLTGERDPLVDDTVIFAGRIRQAKLHRFRERQELGLEKSKVEFDEKAHVEVTLIPGISHGFLNFVSLFPEGWKQLFRCARWIQDLRAASTEAGVETENGSTSSLNARRRTTSELSSISRSATPGQTTNGSTSRHHQRGLTGESSADDDRPLEMSLRMTKLSPSRSPSQSQSSSLNSSPAPSSSSTSPEPPDDPAFGMPPDIQYKTGKGIAIGPAGDTEHPELRPTTASSATPSDPPSKRAGRPQRSRGLTLDLKCAPPNRAVEVDMKNDVKRKDRSSANEVQNAMMLQRQASITSLASEEDLLGRRMNGLAGGLMGIGEDARTP